MNDETHGLSDKVTGRVRSLKPLLKVFVVSFVVCPQIFTHRIADIDICELFHSNIKQTKGNNLNKAISLLSKLVCMVTALQRSKMEKIGMLLIQEQTGDE